jgi:hypothetical protein
MGVEATLLNLPKWMLDKRALNQPVLPVPFRVKGARFQNEGQSIMGGAGGMSIDEAFPGIWCLPELASAINEPVDGAFVQVYSASGPGVLSSLYCGAIATKPAGTYNVDFAVKVDGKDVFTPNNISVESNFSGGIAEVVGAAIPPLLFKESLTIEKQVVVRSSSSSTNNWRIFGTVYIPV